MMEKIEKLRLELYNLVENEENTERYYERRYELSTKLDELIVTFYKNKGERLCK